MGLPSRWLDWTGSGWLVWDGRWWWMGRRWVLERECLVVAVVTDVVVVVVVVVSEQVGVER